ncbi:MAG: hypothetical protein ACOH2H_05810 [Cypionkella sp.]
MMEPLPPLLERTAAILADSARLLLQIEDSITPLLSRVPHSGSVAVSPANFRASVVSLQKIDLLSQTLEDLSFWLEDLAEEAKTQISGAVAPEAAMTRLRLADLRHRLHGLDVPQDARSQSEPMLF